MRVISREELKAKLDRDDDFKLVMTMGDWAFEAKHIPGSLNISNQVEAAKQLNVDEEIVVYCTNVSCPASIAAYNMLETKGYKNIYRYSGGLEAWEEAGYPLEGNAV
jgi:thiosulfate/3-mercaptopyruvate sulfurtransferase